MTDNQIKEVIKLRREVESWKAFAIIMPLFTIVCLAALVWGAY